ncbi:MAG: hypothetical protein WC150_08735 [Bacteroidia bacterium]
MNTTNPDKQQPQWPKESPFKVPDSYFDELSESILCRINNNLREETPGSMHLLKDAAPDSIPQNYFAELPEKILARTSLAKPKGRIVYLNIIKYAAAVVVISGVALFYLRSGNQSTSTQVSMEQLSEDEITTYLLKNAGVELLAEAYTETKPTVESNTGNQDSSDAMEQYLLEHADESELMEDDI